MRGNTNKQEWSSKWTFIFAAVSSAVGLGNIWRFPFVAYSNGGGAFIIPYFVAIFLISTPMLILEVTYGAKFRGTTPLTMARVKRSWEFLGWIPALAGGLITFYYGVILVWAGHYAVFSVNKSWGTDTANFFTNEFLGVTGNALSFGGIRPTLFIGMALLWGISYLVMSVGVKKGLERVNKIILPIMLISAVLLLIRGVTLEHAHIGLNALFTPDFSVLSDPTIWLSAFGMALFSLSLCMGIMVTYGSYLKKGTEIVNTSYMIAFVDVIFAFLFSVGIFSILGYMAGTEGVPIEEVATGGAGLVFVTLPIALNYMGGFGSIMGVAFFIMLAVTGWTSFLSLQEAFIAPFLEKFGIDRKKGFGILSILGFGASIVYTTGAGQIILGLVDFTINTYALPLVAVLQAVLVGWIVKKLPEFQSHINENSIPYFKANSLWIFSVKYLTPILLSVSLVMSVYRLFMDTPGIYAARTLPEVLVFAGGVVAILVFVPMILSKINWSVSVEDYESNK
jgi:NSS family neurotransmitter:Na+ symporter